MGFTVTKQSGGDYKLAPQGVSDARIIDVIDLGMVAVAPAFRKPGGPAEKHKLRIKWETAAGDTFIRDYTASLHEKATLYKDIKAMTQKEPADPFDVSTLKGQQNQVMLVHGVSKAGKTFANIAGFLPARPGVVFASDSGVPAAVPSTQANATANAPTTAPADVPF